MKAVLQELARKLTNIVFRAYLPVFSGQLAMKIGSIELYRAFITIAVRLTYCCRECKVPIVRWQSSREMKQLKIKGVIKYKNKNQNWFLLH
jgi:hypothetical protein